MNRKPRRAERADGIKSRQTILNAAARLATLEGLDGLSIGRLAEHIGMSKSGLYAHFGSKEELQLATIETAREIFDDVVVKPVLSIDDPVQRVVALCDRFLDHVERRVFPGGCFFASVAAEFDTRPGSVRASILDFEDDWVASITELIESAQQADSIDPGEDPRQLAFELNAYLLMANSAYLMYDNALALERARRAITTRLAAARSRPPSTSRKAARRPAARAAR
jgi:AcrR family transcriptional regulator